MKIKVYVATNRVGSKMESFIEVDEAELEGMTEEQRNVYLDAILSEWVNDAIESGWAIV